MSLLCLLEVMLRLEFSLSCCTVFLYKTGLFFPLATFHLFLFISGFQEFDNDVIVYDVFSIQPSKVLFEL